MIHGFFFGMGGLALDDSENPDKFLETPAKRFTMSPRFIVWCLEHRYADVIPYISEEDIKDKSKADSLVKTIACIQALWFCLQVATRLAQKLPISLLELNTLAHSICALFLYILWWEKPLDVSEPALVPTARSDRMRTLSAYAFSHSNLKRFGVDEKLLAQKSAGFEWQGKEFPLVVSRVSDFSIKSNIAARRKRFGVNGGLDLHQAFTLVVTGLLYGGLHALALGLALNSKAETLLWEISSLVVACSGPLGIALFILMGFFEEREVKHELFSLFRFCCLVLMQLIFYFHCFCRVFLVVEVFLALPHADPGIYLTPNWTIYIPHIA